MEPEYKASDVIAGNVDEPENNRQKAMAAADVSEPEKKAFSWQTGAPIRKISYEDSAKLPNYRYVDTRSPSEFAQDHIPGAINIPIFDDRQRAVVGTIYKRQSPDMAYETGRLMFEKKMDEIRSEIRKAAEGADGIVVYCWRGGLRSRTITEMAQACAINCFQLEDGHKAYRAYVRQRLGSYELKPKIVVLFGLTGVGKTRLIMQFPNMIDLEGLAQHRSSLFGAVGLRPNSQKMFESMLLRELDRLSDEQFIILEGESRKVGDVFVPGFLFDASRNAINIRVELDIEKRAENIVREYMDTEENIRQTYDVLDSLVKRIGKKPVAELRSLMEKKEYQAFARMLLELYYDPLYKHTIDSFEYGLTVESSNVSAAAQKIRNYLKNI